MAMGNPQGNFDAKIKNKNKANEKVNVENNETNKTSADLMIEYEAEITNLKQIEMDNLKKTYESKIEGQKFALFFSCFSTVNFCLVLTQKNFVLLIFALYGIQKALIYLLFTTMLAKLDYLT